MGLLKLTVDDWGGVTVAGSILAFLRAEASRNIKAMSPRSYGAENILRLCFSAPLR